MPPNRGPITGNIMSPGGWSPALRRRAKQLESPHRQHQLLLTSYLSLNRSSFWRQYFSLEPGRSSDRVFEVDDKLVLLQLVDRFPPEDEAVNIEIDPERERLAVGKQQNYVIAWINQRRAELEAKGELNIDVNAFRGIR